jgi:hypothetical protein
MTREITVGELIKTLQKFDATLPAWVECTEFCSSIGTNYTVRIDHKMPDRIGERREDQPMCVIIEMGW